MSCRCAVGIWNFHFDPLGSYKGRTITFSVIKACHLNSIFISKIRGMCNEGSQFWLLFLESNKGLTMLFLSEYCNFNSLFISRSSKQRLCQEEIRHVLYISNKITNLNPLYARILCAKFAQLFLSRRILKVVKVFSLCGHYLFHNTLCQVCLKSAQRFWRRIFSKVADIFSPSRCDLQLGKKKQGHLFEQI